jgi:hypothetical protein
MSGFPKAAVAYNPALQYNDLLGWSCDPAACYSTLALYPGAANLALSRIPLPTSMTITNVLALITALGVTLTHSFLALFKSNGVVIGQSADQSINWKTGGSAGLYTLPLAGGPFVCTPLGANDFVWAAIYIGTGVTMPTFVVDDPAYGAMNFGTTTARSRNASIAQADTPTLASFSPAGLTVQGQELWMGIS